MVHEQMRQAREAKGMSLTALEHEVGVRVSVLESIERGAFGELPAGLYGRHAVRAYATAVGLDADAVLDEAGQLLPIPEDPLDGLARVRGFVRRSRPTVADEERMPVARPHALATPEPGEPTPDWRRFAASAIDGAVLVCVVLALAQLTAVAAGTPMSDVIAVAFPAWALMAALISATYFVLLGGIRNATLGVAAVGAPVEGRRVEALDARYAIRRGLKCALRESSIVVECLIGDGHNHGWIRALNQRS